MVYPQLLRLPGGGLIEHRICRLTDTDFLDLPTLGRRKASPSWLDSLDLHESRLENTPRLMEYKINGDIALVIAELSGVPCNSNRWGHTILVKIGEEIPLKDFPCRSLINLDFWRPWNPNTSSTTGQIVDPRPELKWCPIKGWHVGAK